jgi:hypothetical protein
MTLIYFLFFSNSINRCTRCLLFIDRSTNLLQYRESTFLSFFLSKGNIIQSTFHHLGECNDADELSSVTLCRNMIAPDAPLYTLYRSEYYYYYCCFNIQHLDDEVKGPCVYIRKER